MSRPNVRLAAMPSDIEALVEDTDPMMRQARKASDFLKALSHENRLLLLCLLSERERTVGELEAALNLRQPTVSQQLARLRLDGLVTTRREGKTITYSLASEDVRRVIQVIHEIFCAAPAGKSHSA
jgi:DNA-binding transcriptional ArsR family regulator